MLSQRSDLSQAAANIRPPDSVDADEMPRTVAALRALGSCGGRLARRCRGRAVFAPLVLTPLVLSAAGLLAAGCQEGRGVAQAASAAEPLVSHRGNLARRWLLSGELVADSGAVLSVPKTPSWQVTIRWLVADGARVAAGDLLAELDNTTFASELEDRRLKVLEAEQQLAQRRLALGVEREKTTLAVARAEVELTKAQRQAAVPEELLGRQERDERELAAKKAEISRDKAATDLATLGKSSEAELAQLGLDLREARRAVAEVEQSITAFSIRAPAAGTVVIADHPWERRKLRAGDDVWVGAELLRLPDFAHLTVRAALSDVDQGAVVSGQTVRCLLDAFPERPFAGVVREVAEVAREERGGSPRRFFEVVVEPDASALAPDEVRPGLSVKVEAAARAAAAVLVPRAALDPAALATLAGPVRARLASGEAREIAIAGCDAQSCQVESGLDAGVGLAPWQGGEVPP